MHLRFWIADSGNQLRRRVSALAKSNQGFGEMFVRMHGDVAGDVVEDIGFRKIVELVGAADGNGSGKFPIAKTVEEEKGRYVAAHGFGLEAGQRTKEAIDIFQARYSVRIQAQRVDPFEKMRVGVAMPAREHALVELRPGLVVFVGIQVVGLRNV